MKNSSNKITPEQGRELDTLLAKAKTISDERKKNGTYGISDAEFRELSVNSLRTMKVFHPTTA